MTAKSFWWETGVAGDGLSEYTEIDHSRWVRVVGACSGHEGIGPGYGDAFDAQANPTGGSDRKVRIKTGGAIVDGKALDQDVLEDMLLDTTPTYRRDRIVLKCEWGAVNTVRITVLKGTDGSETPPTIPAPNPTTLVYQALWQVRIVSSGAVTLEADERVFASITDEVTIELNTSAGVIRVKSSGITAAQIAPDAVGTSELAIDAVENENIAANAVETDNLVNNAVFEDKIGERVLGLDRRQGGDINDWDDPGPTNRTPGNLRMRVGSIQWTGGAVGNGTKSVTFPIAFANTPLVFITALDYEVIGSPLAPGTTGFTINWKSTVGAKTAITFFWMAIGDE